MTPSVLGVEVSEAQIRSSLSQPLEARHWCVGRWKLDLCRSVFRDAARGHIWLRGSHDSRHLYHHLWLHHQFRRHNFRRLDDIWHVLTPVDLIHPYSSYIHPYSVFNCFCLALCHLCLTMRTCRFCIGLSQSASQLFSLFPLHLPWNVVDLMIVVVSWSLESWLMARGAGFRGDQN